MIKELLGIYVWPSISPGSLSISTSTKLLLHKHSSSLWLNSHTQYHHHIRSLNPPNLIHIQDVYYHHHSIQMQPSCRFYHRALRQEGLWPQIRQWLSQLWLRGLHRSHSRGELLIPKMVRQLIKLASWEPVSDTCIGKNQQWQLIHLDFPTANN